MPETESFLYLCFLGNRMAKHTEQYECVVLMSDPRKQLWVPVVFQECST